MRSRSDTLRHRWPVEAADPVPSVFRQEAVYGTCPRDPESSATQRILTLQLRELEADGVILRHVHAQIPPKVEYEISAFGQSLGPILLALRHWGEQFRTSERGLELGFLRTDERAEGARERAALCEAKVAVA